MLSVETQGSDFASMFVTGFTNQINCGDHSQSVRKNFAEISHLKIKTWTPEISTETDRWSTKQEHLYFLQGYRAVPTISTKCKFYADIFIRFIFRPIETNTESTLTQWLPSIFWICQTNLIRWRIYEFTRYNQKLSSTKWPKAIWTRASASQTVFFELI